MSARHPRSLGAIALVLTLLALVAPAAGAQSDDSGPADSRGRVLIISVPRLTWEQVRDDEPANISAFMADSAIGDLSLRTIGPRTSLGEAYVTLGSGNRAGVSDGDAGRMLDTSDRFEDGTAAAAFERRTGLVPSGQLLQMSISVIQARNDRYLYGAKPGSLGTALAEATLNRVVVANADLELSTNATFTFDNETPTGEASDGNSTDGGILEGTPPLQTSIEPVNGENRPAGLTLMDRQGEVANGTVSRDLLVRNSAAPFGIELDPDAVLENLDENWDDDTVALVELSDLERADAYRTRAASDQARALMDHAMVNTDALVGELLDRTEPEDLVILVSPAAPRSGETLTPLALRGPSFESGTLSSGTTRRPGYATLPDIAPTILDFLDIDQPESMTGATMSASNDGDTSAERYLTFIRDNENTKFRDSTVGPVTVIFVIAQVALYALALAALRRGSRRLRAASAALGLVIMCIPLMTFGLGMIQGPWLGFWLYIVLLLLGAGAVAAGSNALGKRASLRTRAVVVTLIPITATYLLLFVDLLFGGRLQLNTIFGYSPLVAGRFSGFGNPAYSLFSMSSVLMACGLWVLLDADRPGPNRTKAVIGVVAIFVLTVVVDGHPSLGSDVGGVLSIIPTAFVVLWLLLGRAIKLRMLALSALVTLGAVALFAFLDLQRPEAQQTHLGRLARSTLGEGGGSGLGTVVERKISANINVLTHSVWTWTIPLALALLVRFTWRRPRLIDGHLDDLPATRAMLWGGITLCVLGMAVNDSGISIPAVMFMLWLPAILFHAMTPSAADDPWPDEPAEPEAPPPPTEDAEPEPAPV